MNADSKEFRVLSLDGGGSKGVYTLGVLKEVEAAVAAPLYRYFGLIYGTSTGAIIAALLALGKTVTEIEEIYFTHIPHIMSHRTRRGRSLELRKRASTIFGNLKFDQFKTNVGLVATNYELERPMIFKRSVVQAHSMAATFTPGFGCTIAEAIVASASAFPFFERAFVKTINQGTVELMDGGFVANNPTLFAIADALNAFNSGRENVKVLSVGVGHYNEPQRNWYSEMLFNFWPFKMIQKLFASNTNTIEILRKISFSDVACVRIDDAYPDPKYETDLLEADRNKLRKLFVLGRESYSKQEREFLAIFGAKQ
jgi:patatin-like phospholipase/acyl hydrolase